MEVVNVATTNDKSPHLTIKDAILVRSGIYTYSRDEVLAMGYNPTVDKPFYREYRPAGAIIAAKDKCNMIPVTRDHPPVDVSSDNFSSFASGVTGGPIEAVTLEDGEIGLKGKMAFFTKDAHDAYINGTRETSLGLQKTFVEMKEPDKVGFDFLVKDILSVNHIALVPKGRGGQTVRVMDKAMVLDNQDNGGKEMDGVITKPRKNILSILGIVKSKDENFKFSSVLLDSVAKVSSLDEAGLEKEVLSVMSHVNALGESEAKEVLVGIATDCFNHATEVLSQRDVVAEKVDMLYAKCKDADAAVVASILDAKPTDPVDEEDKEPEAAKVDSKDSSTVNIGAVVEAAVQKALGATVNSIDAKIEAVVRKSLGLEKTVTAPAASEAPVEVAATDGVHTSGDSSWLFKDAFGVR